jgi:histone acetyltransferase
MLGESGWTPPVKRKIAPLIESPDTAQMQKLLDAMNKHAHGWPFLKPVGPEIPDYLETIKKPMDFQTMGEKLKANKYANLAAFIADAQLVFDNCLLFNPAGTAYHSSAKIMHKWLKQRTANQVKREDIH